jgi:hypothetical protein
MDSYEQQAKDFCAKWGVTMKAGVPSNEIPAWDTKVHSVFPVTLRRNRKSMKVAFAQSLAQGNKVPTEYEVLTAITKYNPGSFENFCSEFGYNPDSRRDETIYKGVVKEWKAVQRVFDDEKCLAELREII